MIDPRWAAARRILAIRLDNLGDVLVTTPAIHAIRESLPNAEITLLASPVGAQAGRLNPDIADVIESDAPWMDPWQQLPQDPAREQALIATLREEQFDGAVIFTSYRQSPLPAAYLCYLAGIPLRLGATMEGAGSLLTTRLKRQETLAHEVERNLDLVAAVGLATADRRLVLDVPPGVCDRMDAWWTPESGPRVVVHPGCSMPARTYPVERYVEVVRLLVERLDAQVAITGAAGERGLIDALMAQLSFDVRERVTPLAGTLDFPELCGLIQTADLTITNNTGPMHVAAAVGTPVVALFALTNPPEQWGPWMVPHRLLNHDVPCRICYERICPRGHECLASVTPEEVFDAAIELLAECQATRRPVQVMAVGP
jgi:ADP-heptose:LPS heptosyltransferase